MTERDGARSAYVVIAALSFLASSSAHALVAPPGATRTPLDTKTRARLERFLFPLPQECRIGNEAFSFPPASCSLKAGPELTVQEKQFVADFGERWKQKFGTVPPSAAAKTSGFTIIVGRNGANESLGEAARARLLDLAHLGTRPNREQAYAVTCTRIGAGAVAYLAANDSPGIYYALGTFEQLLGGLSSASTVVVAEARIVDWPDIPLRGIWGSVRDRQGEAMSAELAVFSSYKLNLWDRRSMKVRIDKDGKFWYRSLTELLEQARRRNVCMIPHINHLSHYFHSPWHSDLYKLKHQLTADEGIKGHGRVWCWHKPEGQRVLHRMMERIAETDGIDDLTVWLSEGGKTACHCAHCKGDVRANFVNEARNVLEAYRKVKRKHPGFRLSIMTTQGSYPVNDEIFELIPKEVGIVFYGGSGKGNTYHNENRPLLDGYPTETLSEKGHTLGALPLLAASHLPGVGLFPFNTPSLPQQRMRELHAKHVSRVFAWVPWTIFMNDVNVQGEAEYAWNVDGRSLEEFAVSWATRKGHSDPEAVAQIMNLLDEPSRALSNGINANRFNSGVNRMVDLLLRVEPKWGTYHDLLKGLDRGDKVGHANTLVRKCDDALRIARRLGDKEFIAGSALMKRWVEMLLEYARFQQSTREHASKEKAKDEILRLAAELPRLWLDWVVFQPIPERRKKSVAGRMQSIMIELGRIRKMPDANAIARNWVNSRASR